MAKRKSIRVFAAVPNDDGTVKVGLGYMAKSLTAMQYAVGGYIEIVHVTIGGRKFELVCNEEALFDSSLRSQVVPSTPSMTIVGAYFLTKARGSSLKEADVACLAKAYAVNIQNLLEQEVKEDA